MFININYADKIGYFELILYNNHNHTNKRPLTPKSMPPTNNVHAKLFRNLMDNINSIILLGLSVQIIKGLFPPSTYDSFEDALNELDSFLDDEQEAFEEGNIESPYDRDEFRIAEVA